MFFLLGKWAKDSKQTIIQLSAKEIPENSLASRQKIIFLDYFDMFLRSKKAIMSSYYE